MVILDAAHTDETRLITRLEELLGAEVTKLVVLEIDLVRDSTEVDVRYRLRDRPAGPSEQGRAHGPDRSLAIARAATPGR